jgi:hypothetical protein
MYPMPNFASMKGQELVDCYNTYASKPRQGKFHDNEQGRRVCEDLWRKWVAKNPPKANEVAPPPASEPMPVISDPAWDRSAPVPMYELDSPAVQEQEQVAGPQEWDVAEAPRLAPVEVVKHPSRKASNVVEVEEIDEVTHVSAYTPRAGSKWATMSHKLQHRNGMTLSEGMSMTGWASGSVVSSAIHRMAAKMGKVLTCERREGKESLFRMKG